MSGLAERAFFRKPCYLSVERGVFVKVLRGAWP